MQKIDKFWEILPKKKFSIGVHAAGVKEAASIKERWWVRMSWFGKFIRTFCLSPSNQFLGNEKTFIFSMESPPQVESCRLRSLNRKGQVGSFGEFWVPWSRSTFINSNLAFLACQDSDEKIKSSFLKKLSQKKLIITGMKELYLVISEKS